MRGCLVLFCVAVLVPVVAGCHRTAGVRSPAMELQTAQSRVEAIGQLKPQLRKAEHPLVTGTDGGGQLIAFFDDTGVRLIEVRVGLSSRNVFLNYYYHAKELICCARFEAVFTLDADGGYNEMATVPGKTEVAYFANGKAISQNSKGIPGGSRMLDEARFFMGCFQDASGEIDIEDFIKREAS